MSGFLTPDRAIPTKGKGSKLTPKMERFVDEFMISLNATEACLKAGYKTTNPNRVGSELKRHPLVMRTIEERTADKRERQTLSEDFIINKLINIVANTESGNPQAALRGLELLGKHLGLFKDRTEISGPDGKAIEYEQRIQQDSADFTSAIARLVKRGGSGDVAESSDTGATG